MVLELLNFIFLNPSFVICTARHACEITHQSCWRSGTTGRSFQKLQLQNRKRFCSAGMLTHPLSVTESHSDIEEDDKIGVLLLNLGGPETLHDVQPFLYNLFADPVCFLFSTSISIGFVCFSLINDASKSI